MREKDIRANAVIILGKDKYNIARRIKKPVFFGKVEPIKPEDTKKSIFAFAGIGRPQKFYKSLKECGFGVVKTLDFADHHKYSYEDLRNIIAQARGLEIWTTAKDFVKIPPSMQNNFNVLNIEIKWEDEKALKDFIIDNI